MPDESPTPEQTIDSNRYAGPVYVEDTSGSGSPQDDFHADLATMLDKFAQRGTPLPEAIYTVAEVGVPAPDARQHVADHLDATESHEAAMESIGGDAILAMQAFFDAWWADCGVVNWHKGPTRIVLSPEHRAEYDRRRAEWAAIVARNEAERAASAARWQAEMEGSPDLDPPHDP